MLKFQIFKRDVYHLVDMTEQRYRDWLGLRSALFPEPTLCGMWLYWHNGQALSETGSLRLCKRCAAARDKREPYPLPFPKPYPAGTRYGLVSRENLRATALEEEATDG